MGGRTDGWTPELQDKLSEFVGLIYEAVGQDPGYCDLALNFREVTVEVYFHGPFPDTLRPVIERARDAGVGVKRVATDYGELELRRATYTLGSALRAEGIHWNRMGPTPQFSGLQIAGPEVSGDRFMQRRAQKIAAELIGDIPVTFVPDEGPLVAGLGTFRSQPPSDPAE